MRQACGQLRSSASITQVLKYSVDLYKKLDGETGLATGWKMTGCLRLANNENRWTEYKRLATTAQSFGMEMHLLSPAEVKKMWPLLNVDDWSAPHSCLRMARHRLPISRNRLPRVPACMARSSLKVGAPLPSKLATVV